jgi:hypothetical protein
MGRNSEKLLFRSEPDQKKYQIEPGFAITLDFLEIHLNPDTGGIQDGVYDTLI